MIESAGESSSSILLAKISDLVMKAENKHCPFGQHANVRLIDIRCNRDKQNLLLHVIQVVGHYLALA